MEIGIGKNVVCTDGKCAHLDRVVIEKKTLRAVGLVVKRGMLTPRQIVVPLDLVFDVDSANVFLRASEKDLQAYPDLIESDYVPIGGELHHHPDREDEALLLTSPEIGHGIPLTPVESEFEEPLLGREIRNTPQNSISIGHSTQVETPEGKIGVVERVLLDPVSNKLTHLVVRRETGARTVTIPAQSFTYFGEQKIGLNLSRQEVEKMTHATVH